MKLFKILILITTLIYNLNANTNLDIKQMSLKDFIELSSNIIKKNIVSSENLNNKINFFSANDLKSKDINNIIGSILTKNNLLLIDKGEYLLLTNKNNLRNIAPKLVNSLNNLNDYVIISYYINAGVHQAQSLKNKLFPYLSRIGRLTTDNINNSLLITDYVYKIKQIKNIISKLNKNDKKTISINLKLKNELTKEVFNMILKYAKYISRAKIKERFEIIPNYYNNSIDILASKKFIKEMKKYIISLNESKNSSSIIEIYFLKNALAEDTVKILKEILVQKETLKNRTEYKYSIDKELNSIIVSAPSYLQKKISTLIKKLDVPRKQVYVKSSIIEINKDSLKKLGVKWGIDGLNATSSGLISLGTNLTGSSLTGNLPNLLSSNFDGISKSAFLLGISLEFLENHNTANVLSEPSILCVNNKSSNIYIGQTESILTSSSSPSTGGIVKNFSRQDIGLSLKILPRILQNSLVNLEVSTKLEGIVTKETTEVGTPTTTKRTIETNVIVENGKSIIIGGLIKQGYTIIKNKVPILGDIPWIGKWVFTYKSKEKKDTNLIIILTPYIINSPTEYYKITDKLNKLEKEKQHVYNTIFNNKEK